MKASATVLKQRASSRSLHVTVRCLLRADEMKKDIKNILDRKVKSIEETMGHKLHVEFDKASTMRDRMVATGSANREAELADKLVVGLPFVQYPLLAPRNMAQVWNQLLPKTTGTVQWMSRQGGGSRRVVTLRTPLDYFPFPKSFPDCRDPPLSTGSATLMESANWTRVDDFEFEGAAESGGSKSDSHTVATRALDNRSLARVKRGGTEMLLFDECEFGTKMTDLSLMHRLCESYRPTLIAWEMPPNNQRSLEWDTGYMSELSRVRDATHPMAGLPLRWRSTPSHWCAVRGFHAYTGLRRTHSVPSFAMSGSLLYASESESSVLLCDTLFADRLTLSELSHTLDLFAHWDFNAHWRPALCADPAVAEVFGRSYWQFRDTAMANPSAELFAHSDCQCAPVVGPRRGAALVRSECAALFADGGLCS